MPMPICSQSNVPALPQAWVSWINYPPALLRRGGVRSFYISNATTVPQLEHSMMLREYRASARPKFPRAALRVAADATQSAHFLSCSHAGTSSGRSAPTLLHQRGHEPPAAVAVAVARSASFHATLASSARYDLSYKYATKRTKLLAVSLATFNRCAEPMKHSGCANAPHTQLCHLLLLS